MKWQAVGGKLTPESHNVYIWNFSIENVGNAVRTLVGLVVLTYDSEMKTRFFSFQIQHCAVNLRNRFFFIPRRKKPYICVM